MEDTVVEASPSQSTHADVREPCGYIEIVRYCLLSVFPLILETSQEKAHFYCLLNLAESVDTVLLTTMSDTARPMFREKSANRIRPKDMPRGDFEGLNRALPTS